MNKDKARDLLVDHVSNKLDHMPVNKKVKVLDKAIRSLPYDKQDRVMRAVTKSHLGGDSKSILDLKEAIYNPMIKNHTIPEKI